jgi:hypothetical protein
MGESHGWLFEPTFNKSIKLRQADPRITSDAGALLLREVDHCLGLTADLAGQLHDPRDPAHIRYTQAELLRQHIYGLAHGYSHQDDADTTAHDIAFKLASWDRPGRRVAEERLASQPSDWRLVNRLSSPSQRRALNEALALWVGRHQRAAGGGRAVTHGTIDIDPFPIEVHGRQEGGAYNGYYKTSVYHPIVASFAAEGSYESSRLGEGVIHAILRRGNSHSASGAMRFVRESIRKARPLARHLDVRIDAGLVAGKVLDVIDDEGVSFVGRIRNNAVLDRISAPFLWRPPGRPPKDGRQLAIDVGNYRAESWTRPYRLVLVIVDLPDPKTGTLELFPHHFFLVSNWTVQQRSGWQLLEHYRNRGTFEDRFGEFNSVIGPSLPAESFAANEAALLLKLLAFNLAGMIRGELEGESGAGWDLGRVQRTVLRVGARIVEHGRRLFVDIADAAGVLWGRLVERIGWWWRDNSWGRDDAGRRRGPRPRPWVDPPKHAHLHLVLRE